MKRLTEIVHDRLRAVLTPDDVAIDATAGNGHDTLAMAKLARHVYAFEIQETAIEAARRIAPANVTLILADHASMKEHIPRELHGTIAAVVFNLGYLPGGDKSIITKPASTVRALQAAWELLKPGGLLSVMTYPGHAGGDLEDEAVCAWIEDKTCERVESKGPRLYAITKPRASTTISSPL
jgi:16S rRNA C1402 N4-methylase RsmH